MTVLSTWSPEDGILGAVAPLALASAARTALVVDVDPDGPPYPSQASLADLVADGPRSSDLRPPRRGVAVLRNGGVDADDASDVVAALIDGWPAVVLRLPAHPPPTSEAVVPVFPLSPVHLFVHDGPAVYQRGPWAAPAPVDGVVLPRPRAGTIRSLLEGRRPGPSRWLRAWSEVWRRSWP